MEFPTLHRHLIMSSRPRPNKISSKSWPIETLPGLSPDNQKNLKHCGIKTTAQLLQETTTQARREAIATQLRIHPQYLTKWIALANLARIPSVGCIHCGTLLHAGIASPEQLVQTPLPRLHRQILKLHISMMQSKDHCPSLDEVAQWQHQARLITHSR